MFWKQERLFLPRAKIPKEYLSRNTPSKKNYQRPRNEIKTAVCAVGKEAQELWVQAHTLGGGLYLGHGG